jgi:uncharacterized protein YggL (DUF469 family)
MNKRQRKKKRVGEFREFGVAAAWRFKTKKSGDEVGAFLDGLFAFVDAEHLGVGGVTTPFGASHFVTHDGRALTAEHVERLRAWAEARSDIAEAWMSALVDANYGPWPKSPFTEREALVVTLPHRVTAQGSVHLVEEMLRRGAS